jgi:hypothetical protein
MIKLHESLERAATSLSLVSIDAANCGCIKMSKVLEHMTEAVCTMLIDIERMDR